MDSNESSMGSTVLVTAQMSQSSALMAKKLKRTHEQRTKRISTESLPTQESIMTKTSHMNVELTDIIKNLPFDDREKVTSLVNMAVYSSDCHQKENHAISIELKALKASYRVKMGELADIQDELGVYRNQVEALEEKLNSLEDDAESRQNYSLRNSKAISRLSSTNKTLIDAFALIHEGDSMKKGSAHKSNDELTTIHEGGSRVSNNTGVKLSPIARRKKRSRKKDIKRNTGDAEQADGTPVTSNEKLRERLLRVAKEHSRVEKNCTGLETKIMGLRSSLRVAERRNRQLQLELDELKEHINSDNAGHRNILTIMSTEDSFSDNIQKEVVKSSGKSQVPMTNRLNALVARNAFDATEGIKQIDALILHLAQTPSTMLEADIAFHLCTRYASRIFDCEAIVLFVLQPGGKIMHRYATGEVTMTVIEVGEESSIAENTLRTGAMRRYNNNIRSSSLFNPTVDGVNTVNTKRVLTFPLRNKDKTLAVGAMHLLNKRNNNKFTEVDELYGSAFSDVVGSFFSCSILFKRLWLESETLCGIMRASRRLLETLPPDTSIVASRELQPEEVLYSIEHIIRNALKCSQVKAFLLSTHCGYSDEFFIVLEKSSIAMMTLKPEHLSCQHIPFHSGIAGHVAFTKTSYLVSDPSSDALFNTQIDITNKCQTFYCVPILNIAREVIAVIQVVPSALSPNLKSSKEMGDSTVAFENAIDWLLYLVSANFSFMVQSIGHPLPRPDIQYLEPITLTEKFTTKTISLEVAPLDEKSTDVSSKPNSPVESGRQRSRTVEDLNEEEEDDDEHLFDNSDEFDDEEDEDNSPLSGNITNKYERQILSLEKEIEALKSSDNDVESSASKEEELRIRRLLQDEYTSKYETDLAHKKVEIKRKHELEIKKLLDIDVELQAIRDDVALKSSDNDAAEEEMRRDEEKKDEDNCSFIKSLQCADDTVNDSVAKDEGIHGVFNEVSVDEVSTVEINGNVDRDTENQPNEKININSGEKPQDEVLSNVDVAPPPIASARSNKSIRSEIPPTPTKEEVEASPRIGNWIESFDQDGYKYYYNTVTEESSWEKPEGFIEVTAVNDTYNDEEEAKDVVRIGDWLQATTDDGHVYWVHDMTGESTWDTPTDDSTGALSRHSPQGHSQSTPVLSQYGGNAKVSAGDYSIEL
jgi:hypothetical protein